MGNLDLLRSPFCRTLGTSDNARWSGEAAVIFFSRNSLLAACRRFPVVIVLNQPTACQGGKASLVIGSRQSVWEAEINVFLHSRALYRVNSNHRQIGLGVHSLGCAIILVEPRLGQFMRSDYRAIYSHISNCLVHLCFALMQYAIKPYSTVQYKTVPPLVFVKKNMECILTARTDIMAMVTITYLI